MICMVAPSTQGHHRAERRRALIEWDAKLHATLHQLREVLNRIKEMDRPHAEPDSRQDPR